MKILAAAYAKLSGYSLVAGRAASGSQAGGFHAFWPLANCADPSGFTFISADDSAVDAACLQAESAFASHPADAAVSDLLLALAADLLTGEPELLAVAGRETGLSRVRLAREFARMIVTLKFFAGIARAGTWRELLHSPPLPVQSAGAFNTDLVRTNIALGPVAVFTASNFPFAYGVCGGDFASALACGCPVVIKGHPAHPATGETLAGIVARAIASRGLHAGMFSFLHAGGLRERDVGRELLLHPAIRASGFTGSVAGGEALRHLVATERAHDPIPLFAENGSCNLVLVCRNAAASRAPAIANAIVQSIVDSSGQQCTKPGIIAVETGGGGAQGTEAATIASLIAVAFAGTAGRPMLSPRIADAYAARINQSLNGQAKPVGPMHDGLRPAFAGTSARLLSADIASILAERSLLDEIFGPAAVYTSGELSELTRLVRASRGMLVASIFADQADAASVNALLPELASRSGRIVLNGVTTGVRVAPAMVHGGPHPATSAPFSTAVGPLAARRWTRPICLQHVPGDPLAPVLLKLAGPRET